MKQWLSTPVTYGCMIRILLICIFVFLLLVSVVDVAFNIGSPHWTAVSATILIVLAIIIGPVGQWLVSLSTPAVSHGITIEQAFELLKKKETR